MPHYGSFLVRWWQADDDRQRLAIRHIQSDAELAVSSPAEALAWMDARIGEGGRDPPTTGDEERGGPARGPT